MNKYSKIIILFLTVIVLLIIAIAINKFKDNGDEKISGIISKNNITKVEEELSMLKAVIIRVDNDKFHVMSNVYGLITFKYNEDNNTNYKNGQEILIYYTDGIIQTAPARIGNIVNIEIVKENSDIQIPENIIKTVYNSKENVSMSVFNSVSCISSMAVISVSFTTLNCIIMTVTNAKQAIPIVIVIAILPFFIYLILPFWDNWGRFFLDILYDFFICLSLLVSFWNDLTRPYRSTFCKYSKLMTPEYLGIVILFDFSKFTPTPCPLINSK